MRVCFISGSYPPIRCGIGDYTQKLTTALAKQGVSVSIITSRAGVAASNDGKVTVLPLVSQWNAAARAEILAQLKLTRPQLVNIQYPTQLYGRDLNINLLPTFIRRQTRIPVITTVHEFSTYRGAGKLRVGLSGLTSNRIIVTDQTNLRQIESVFPFLKTKLVHVPIGANIEPQFVSFNRQQQRALYGATESDVVLAYFGFISPSKGLETLLPAFELAQRAYPELRLLLIANHHVADANFADYHRRIEDMLAQLFPRERVYWTDYVSPTQVSAFLASADIAVLPFVDGASLRRTTLLSTLLHGLPTLTTSGAGTIRDGLGEEAGVQLVPPANIPALANAIKVLASDPAERQRLSVHARAFANRFTWSSVAHQTLTIYDQVINAHLL